MPFETGPYVQAACFCERALEEKDGVLTLIRIVDRVTHTVAGAEAPREMPPFTYPIMAVIMLKAGQARGRHELSILRQLPSGVKDTEGPTFPVFLESEDRGHNVVLRMEMVFEQEGVYWFEVLLDGELLTRMPLRAVYSRLTTRG
jgi:hypothetical protein